MNQVAEIDCFKTTYLDWKFDSIDESFVTNIKLHGVMAPVLCIELKDTRYIVDGYKRYQAAKLIGLSVLPFALIPTPEKLTDMLMILQHDDLMTSAIKKIRFLALFKSPLSVEYLAHFKLPFYSHIRKDFDRIQTLSEDAQLFLHQKQFSLKEIVNLLHFSSDLFYHFLNHDDYFSFSKRSFDETLSLTSALMKRLSVTLAEFLRSIHYDDLIQHQLTPQQRLKKLHTTLTDASMPVLIDTQKQIDTLISSIDIPGEIDYDRTLENTGIIIRSKLSSMSDVDELREALSNDSIQSKINQVMDLT